MTTGLLINKLSLTEIPNQSSCANIYELNPDTAYSVYDPTYILLEGTLYFLVCKQLCLHFCLTG